MLLGLKVVLAFSAGIHLIICSLVLLVLDPISLLVPLSLFFTTAKGPEPIRSRS